MTLAMDRPGATCRPIGGLSNKGHGIRDRTAGNEFGLPALHAVFRYVVSRLAGQAR